MHLAHAARLLASARSLAALAPLATAAGVDGPPVPLPRATLADPALAAAGLTRARVATGPGALRAFLGETQGLALRDAARAIAAALARRSPELRWLLVLRDAATGQIALAAWSRLPRGPRVAALVADPARVLDSDADTLRALAASADASSTEPPEPGADLRQHARWLDALSRDALGARFYHTLEQTVDSLARSTALPDHASARELALLYTTRLLFLAFLQAKHWLDADPNFLAAHFDACMTSGGDYHRRILRPLFFGTLNTPRRHRAPAAQAFGRIPFLNGGLFAPTRLERRHRAAHFGDPELGALVVTLLGRHRFTAREDSTTWSEAAIDPEMLGRAFESLMHADDRRATGAFYTPQPLVALATTAALSAALPTATLAPDVVDAALAGHTLAPPAAAALRDRLTHARLLDPACGSGAFLVHALERLATLYSLAGDGRPVSEVRRTVCAASIFGVDVNPTAVWLCELRLWLSVVIELDEPDPHRVPPLPNLDHNIRVGDALAVPPALTPLTRHTWGGAPWGAPDVKQPPPTHATRVATLRARYAALSGPRKLAAARRLDALERTHALAVFDRTLDHLRHARRDLLVALRSRDLFGTRPAPDRAAAARLATLRTELRTLARRRSALAAGGALPFGFAWHFPDAAAAGGFDATLGNPPWVRPHALPAEARDALRTHYASARDAAWRTGAALARAGQGFAAQTDLAAPFTERALALTLPGGAVAFLLPAKLWRTLAGGGLRALVAAHGDVVAFDDWSDAPAAFDAVTYPSLLVARRRPAATPGPSQTPVVRASIAPAPRGALPHPLDPNDPASPWLLLPPDARRAFDLLRAAGPPLGATALTRPTLGVKSGLNAAFLVDVEGRDGPDAFVHAAGRHGTVERALLRPALRGEDLANPSAASTTHILWPYGDDGRPLCTLPPGAARWLAPARDALAARSDARGRNRADAPWWTLFRTEAADPRHPRVVWADLARAPHPRLLPADDPHVPLNSCYAARFDDPTHAAADAKAFATLLRSPPIAAWLAALAEPARGGYRRYLGWTVACLPTPADWALARPLLASVPATADAATHTRAVATAYDVDPDALVSLIAWAGLATPSLAPASKRRPAPHPLRSALAEPAAPAWARRPRPDRGGAAAVAPNGSPRA